MKFAHSKLVSTMDSHLTPSVCTYASLVPRPFPAPVLIACSIKTEGKAWEKESHARRQVDVRVDVRGAVPDEESRGPSCNILSKNLRL